jgi:hypothetical protein
MAALSAFIFSCPCPVTIQDAHLCHKLSLLLLCICNGRTSPQQAQLLMPLPQHQPLLQASFSGCCSMPINGAAASEVLLVQLKCCSRLLPLVLFAACMPGPAL